VYRWAGAPYLFLAGLLAATRLGPILRGIPRHAWLDLALLAVAAGAWLQVVPLPQAWLTSLAPRAAEVVAEVSLRPPADGPAPVSVQQQSGIWAAALLSANILTFLAVRALFAHGGVRAAVRMVAYLGIVFASLGLAQAASGSGAVYWWWEPYGEGADPFATFINRNHFATWVIMAIPACFGYAVARLFLAAGNRPSSHWTTRVVALIDGRALLLLFAAILMTVALLVDLSRSGIVGLACAGLFFVLSGGRRVERRRRSWLVGALATAALVALFFADSDALVRRLTQTVATDQGRVAIWRETLPVVRDFWLTGTGAGTYETAMLVYQRSDRVVSFNQAHNQYLQIAAEGGLLLSIPATLALVAFFGLARRRLMQDRSAVFWIRLGAAAGLVAVMVQNVWETGLRMPANAALAAALAAIVVHAPRHGGEAEDGAAARI